jgi:hypothetical protein
MLIDRLNTIIGLQIVEINYVLTKFHYPKPNDWAQGDWTKVHPDTFVLHGQEWQIKFSNGMTWYLTNPQGNFTNEPFKSNISIADRSIAKNDYKILKVPDDFYWKEILNIEIIGFKLWRRVTHTTKILGFEINKKYQDNIQIIQLLFTNKSFLISTMNGDIGEQTFYPTGYLGDRLGVFFDKQVADFHSVYGLEMKMDITYDSMKNKKQNK